MLSLFSVILLSSSPSVVKLLERNRCHWGRINARERVNWLDLMVFQYFFIYSVVWNNHSAEFPPFWVCKSIRISLAVKLPRKTTQVAREEWSWTILKATRKTRKCLLRLCFTNCLCTLCEIVTFAIVGDRQTDRDFVHVPIYVRAFMLVAVPTWEDIWTAWV